MPLNWTADGPNSLLSDQVDGLLGAHSSGHNPPLQAGHLTQGNRNETLVDIKGGTTLRNGWERERRSLSSSVRPLSTLLSGQDQDVSRQLAAAMGGNWPLVTGPEH